MLQDYKKKRDFSRTPEPEAGDSAKNAKGGKRGSLAFAVQQHAARRMHYDLRLEVDGVLKSWPVPRGPSLDPREKRFATMTEDHPIDYATFEGVIPKGSYGAGQMIVWDSGTYSPDEGGRLSFGDREEADERMRHEIEAGKVSFTLRGRKLKGSWTLVRMKPNPREWLLIKHKDAHAHESRDVLEENKSVLSGLTIEDLKAGRLPDPARQTGVSRNGREAEFPTKLSPMMARLVDDPFSHPDWIFEPKLDGFRALAFVRGGEVIIHSRTGRDLTKNFPEIVAELASQPEDALVLDGELVALNEEGMPDFGLMQQSVELPKTARVARSDGVATIKYYPFDILHLDGVDLTRLPLHERKELLEQVLLPAQSIQLMEHVEEAGEAFYKAVEAMGIEGMVAKRRTGIYEPGARSGSWLKIKKVKSQEFVVCGYTDGTGARAATFGALILGYYEDGELLFAGRAGSGFDQRTLESTLEMLTALESGDRPFAEEPELEGTVPHWVRPELVAQVKFAEWPDAGNPRAPVFQGLRDEVDPKSVRREIAEASVPARPANDVVAAARSVDDDVKDALDQLSRAKKQVMLEVGGHKVKLTNLDKVFWPEADGVRAYTKGDMISFYTRMATFVLPHLRGRPLTLTRYPNGIYGQSFYQKNWEHELPEFVETIKLFSSHNEGDVEYVTVNNLPTLIWLAQLADLELHPWLSRATKGPDAEDLTTDLTGSEEAIRGSVLNYPDFIVFDLDPYIYSGKEGDGEEPELNRTAFKKTVEVALALKEVLDQLSLSSFMKTSGKTGLHIYVPVLRQYNYKITRKTCETIGRFLMQSRPKEMTMEWTVSKRTGKIFLDHNQNVRGKNMASIYSLRPAPGAPVSTPVAWDEIEDVFPTDFTIETIPERVAERGELWADILEAKHDLTRILEASEAE